MTALELLGVLGPLLGGSGALAVWLRARATTAQAREESAAAVVPQLMARLETQDARIAALGARLEGCEARHQASEAKRLQDRADYHNALEALYAALEAQRRTDREACDEEITRRIAEVRADLGTVAERALPRLRAADDTGVHAVEAVVRRCKSDPAIQIQKGE